MISILDTFEQDQYLWLAGKMGFYGSYKRIYGRTVCFFVETRRLMMYPIWILLAQLVSQDGNVRHLS